MEFKPGDSVTFKVTEDNKENLKNALHKDIMKNLSKSYKILRKHSNMNNTVLLGIPVSISNEINKWWVDINDLKKVNQYPFIEEE